MTDIDFDKIQPLRLARGSHQKGSGYGCGMNVVSYLNGDVEITDYPTCSAVLLSRIVQAVNDHLAGHRGMRELTSATTSGGVEFRAENYVLNPEDAIEVIDLAVLTMGTGDHRIDPKVLQRFIAWHLGVHVLLDALGTLSRWDITSAAMEGVIRAILTRDLDELITWARNIILAYREMVGLDSTEVDAQAVYEKTLV